MAAPGCFLGVDGGGTKTRFVLIDGDGRVLAQARRGTTYHPQIGLDGVRRVLAEGVAEVLQGAGAEADAIAYAFFGLPAHGEDSGVAPLLDAIPESILGHRRYRCGNDMVCGWAGAFACADGINVVAGTGSIGYGRRGAHEARAGGWGDAFSDEGSAHWIAVEGLNLFSRMSDGRLPKGPLHAVLRRALKLERDLDLCALVYGQGAGGQGYARGEIAQLSPLVAEAAAQGDAEARAIFERAGRELALIADAIRRQLDFAPQAPVPVSYSGGAFAAGDLLLTPFAAALQALHPAFELRAPLHEPDYGAALYAAMLAGHRAMHDDPPSAGAT